MPLVLHAFVLTTDAGSDQSFAKRMLLQHSGHCMLMVVFESDCLLHQVHLAVRNQLKFCDTVLAWLWETPAMPEPEQPEQPVAKAKAKPVAKRQAKESKDVVFFVICFSPKKYVIVQIESLRMCVRLTVQTTAEQHCILESEQSSYAHRYLENINLTVSDLFY